jgi:hypothetical protein
MYIHNMNTVNEGVRKKNGGSIEKRDSMGRVP